jgi:hypothetical protein
MRMFLGVGLAIVLAGLTYHDGARWQTDHTLWCAAADLAPDKPRALNNCALAHLRVGAYQEALPLLTHAAVTLERREPNRRTTLRTTVRGNQFLVFWALRRNADARAVLAGMDPTDPRTQQFRTWRDP